MKKEEDKIRMMGGDLERDLITGSATIEEIREVVKEEVEAAITKAGNHFWLLYMQSKK